MSASDPGRFNPFPGLRPFESEETHLFFGREVQIDDLLGCLRRKHFVAVVGTSGSGKSSLVRAGLVPALHGGFMVGAGSHWRVGMMRPGAMPIRRLARALERGGVLGADGDAELRLDLAQAVLGRGALGLVEIVRQAQLAPDENVLIVVDQFEELFTYRQARPGPEFADEAAAFVKLLLAASGDNDLRAYVLLTLRSDFLGRCSEFRDLPEAINESLFLVPRMRRTQLQSAIEGPVAVADAKIAPRLTARLLNDLGDDPDQLPVLQHALMRTYEHWEGDHVDGEPIDVRHYEAIGGLAEALSRHADDVYESLDEPSRRIAERLFKALTDGVNGIRRPTTFEDALAITGAPSEVALKAVVEAFRAPGCSFVIPAVGMQLKATTILDISHESLMRIWKRMRTWLEEETQSVQIYRRLSDSAALHARGQAALLRNPDLAIALRWRAEQQPDAAWAERCGGRYAETMRFLDESAAEHSREARGRARSLRLTLAGLVATIVVLLALSGIAYRQLQVASAQRLARIDRNMYEEDTAHSDRVKALLAAAAFSIAPDAEPAEVLLAGAIRMSGTAPQRFAYPLLGLLPASQANGNFASRGSKLFFPLGATSMRVVDLDQPAARVDAEDVVSNEIRVRDAADGVHAVSLNVATGVARMWDLEGDAPRALTSFTVGDVGSADLLDAQVGFDPAGGRLSIATGAGIRQYTTDGGLLVSSQTWDELAAKAGLPRPYPSGRSAHVLSARGNYILFNYPGDGPDWIATATGRAVGSAQHLEAISPDERFAFGSDIPKARELTAYSLVTWRGTHTHIPSTPPVIVGASRDGRLFAYPDDPDYPITSGPKVIRLFDFTSNTEFFKGLPSPPHLAAYEDLTFSADDRYLIADYADRAGARWLAIYSVDPQTWLHAVCGHGKPPLTQTEFAQVAPAEHYVDGCAPFERSP